MTVSRVSPWHNPEVRVRASGSPCEDRDRHAIAQMRRDTRKDYSKRT